MQICRFCLCVVEKTVRLTENVIIDGQFSLLEAVKDVVPEIFIDIVIIPEICLPCVDLIKSAYTFREMCFRTEKTIRQYIFASDNQSADVRIADVYLSLSAKRPPSGSLRPILPAKKFKADENIVTQTNTPNVDNAANKTIAHSSQFTDNSVDDGSSQIRISNVAGGSSVFDPPASPGAGTVAPSNVKQVSLLSSSYMITNDVDSTIKISGVFGNVHFDDVEKSSETVDHPQQNATPSPPPSPADPLTPEDDADEYIEDDGDMTIDDTDTDSESEDLTGNEVIPVKHSDTTALQYIIDNLPEIDEIEDHPEFIEIKNLQRDDVSAKPRVPTPPTVGDAPKPAISDKEVKTKRYSIVSQPKILQNVYESGLHRQLKIVPSEQGNVQEQWTIDILGNYVLDHDYVLMTEEHKNTVRQLAFKQRVYPCKLCKKPMKSVGNLERHLVNHFKKRGSRCPICLLTMSSKLIHSHISLHRIECTVCEVMVQYKDFDTHMSKHKLSNPEYNPKDVKKCCNICNEDVPVSTFVRHYLSHNIETVDPKIVCDLCGMIILRKDLDSHLRKNHSVK